jgi:hypothetical protein
METQVGKRIQAIRQRHKKPKKKGPRCGLTTTEIKKAIALRKMFDNWKAVAVALGTDKKPGAVRMAVFRYRKAKGLTAAADASPRLTEAEIKEAMALRAKLGRWDRVVEAMDMDRTPEAVRMTVYRYRKKFDC